LLERSFPCPPPGSLSVASAGLARKPRTSGEALPVEDDLAGVTGAHGLESLLEFVPLQAMGDDSADVESGLQHDGHLVPGLIHFTSVNASDGVLVEDDLCP